MTAKYKPKILMCSEARISDQIMKSEYQIEGYNCIECFSKNRHTGGVIMYIQSQIKFKIIKNVAVDKMLWFLSIEIWDCEINGIYSVLYRSPNKDINVESSIKIIDEILDEIIVQDKLNVIGGDLNINLNMKNKNSKLIKDMLTRYELKLNVNFVTRNNEANGTMIDVILTNNNEKLKSKVLENEIISDHKTIIVTIKTEINEINKNKTTVISWKKYSKDSLLSNLRKCNWTHFETLDVNKKLALIKTNLLGAVVPLTKELKIRNILNQRYGLIANSEK